MTRFGLRTFQTKLLSLLVMVLVLLQAATLIGLHLAGIRTLRKNLAAELQVGSRILDRVLEVRGQQLSDSVRVLASDFGFREAIASRDRPTIISVLANHGSRISAGAAFLISTEGVIVADTRGGSAVGGPFHLSALVTEAKARGETSAIVSLDGRPHQIVIVPVLGPQPIAWVCMGFAIDESVLDDVRRLTSLDVTLWSTTKSGQTFLVSTLGPEQRAELAALASRGRARRGEIEETIQLGSESYQTVSRPLPTADNSTIQMFLQRSIAEAYQPFAQLQLQIFALSGLALLAALIAAIFFARGVSGPIQRLAGGAEKIQRGDYSTPVHVAQDDEIGRLATAFNKMQTAIADREQQIHAMDQRLALEQHRASLGLLAASVTHEFNNVLMGIQPFVELITRHVDPNSRATSAARSIADAVQRGKRITQQILRFAQPSERAETVLNVAEFLTTIRPDLETLFGPRIRLTVDLPASPVYLMADRGQLHQVLTNLAVNARDVMPSGGTFAIAVDRCPSGSTFPWRPHPTSVELMHLAITDTGGGMTPEISKKVFEPFFTTKKSGGTGLGLAVTQQIIASHGGEVHLESTVGKGTTFHILLPVSASRPAAAVAKEPEPLPTVRRVLVVDDDDSVSAGLTALLEMEGIEVERALSGSTALELAARFHPDAVVLDLGLPDIDGIEVCRRLRERWPQLRVIFSTGRGNLSALDSLLSQTNISVLRKPYEFSDLLRALE